VPPTKGHRDPPALRYTGKRSIDALVELMRDDGGMRIGWRRAHRDGYVIRDAGDDAFMPEMIQRPVADGPVQPEARRCRHVPARVIAPEGEKDVVHEVFRNRARPHERVREPPERRVVLEIQSFERCLVAATNAGNDTRVIQRGCVKRLRTQDFGDRPSHSSPNDSLSKLTLVQLSDMFSRHQPGRIACLTTIVV